jgi:hypothetical protein
VIAKASKEDIREFVAWVPQPGLFTGGAGEVFRAKIRSQQAVWVHSAEVDALFRLIWDFVKRMR